jgi:hypothetical protein
MMGLFFHIYIALWASACLLASWIILTGRGSFAFFHRNYWKFLFKPWKIVTFVIAGAGMTIIAPYTGDPTWDYVDAFFMSVLTYLSAPWAIGAIYKVFRKELPLRQGYVAFCIWMFSASWSYDLYLLLRDGTYPITWFSNMLASSGLYLLAGLFWNLDWVRDKGIIFSFKERGWPIVSSDNVFSKIIWIALPLMAFVASLIIYFFFFKSLVNH